MAQIRRAGARLLGPAQGAFRPLHAHQSGAARLHRRRVRARRARAWSTSAAAAACWPRRCARAARRCTAIDLAPAMIEVARLHALRARLCRSTTAQRAPSSSPRRAAALRRRVLHGDDRARAGPGSAAARRSRGCCGPAATLFVSTHQPQRRARSWSRSSAPSTCCGWCRAARTNTRGCCGRPSWRAHARAAGLALLRPHRPAYDPLTRTSRAWAPTPDVNYLAHFAGAGGRPARERPPRCARGAVRPRRHAARHRARHGRGAQRAARRAWRARRCPSSRVRPQVSHGAAALVRAGFPGSDRRGVRARCGCASSTSTAAASGVDTRLFPGFEDVLAALETAGIPWGIVTNKPGWLTEPLLRDARPARSAPAACVSRRQPAGAQAASAAAAAWPRRCSAVEPGALHLRGRRTSATCRRRAPPACARWWRAFGYLGPDDLPRLAGGWLARSAYRSARRSSTAGLTVNRPMSSADRPHDSPACAVARAHQPHPGRDWPGASSRSPARAAGIGRALALAAARHGAEVVLVGRHGAASSRPCTTRSRPPAERRSIAPLDLENALAPDYDALAAAIEQRYGRLDGLVHNAALLGALAPIEHYDVPDLVPRAAREPDRGLRADPGAAAAAASVARRLAGLHQQRVGRRGRAYWGAYAVSKFGVEGCARCWPTNCEGKPRCASTSSTRADAHAACARQAYPAEDAERAGRARDVADAYLWLLGPASRGVTGQRLDCQPPRLRASARRRVAEPDRGAAQLRSSARQLARDRPRGSERSSVRVPRRVRSRRLDRDAAALSSWRRSLPLAPQRVDLIPAIAALAAGRRDCGDLQSRAAVELPGQQCPPAAPRSSSPRTRRLNSIGRRAHRALQPRGQRAIGGAAVRVRRRPAAAG